MCVYEITIIKCNISRTTHSGPLTRNELLGVTQYVPSANFTTLGQWDIAKFEDVYIVKGSVARTQPVKLTIVCDISSNIHYLQPHGNYKSEHMSTPELIGKKAKLQFIRQCPATDKDLGADYNKSVTVLLEIQGEVATTSERHHFLTPKGQMKFNFNLFEPKVRIYTLFKIYLFEYRLLIVINFAPAHRRRFR